MRRFVAQVLVLVISHVLACGSPGAAATGSEGMDRPGPRRAASERYIVVFNSNVSNPRGLADRLSRRHGGALHHTYQHAIKGFAATLSPAAVTALGKNPNVAYIEPDRPVQPFTVQTNPGWALDRVDQTDLPLDNAFVYGNDASAGSGINIYIIDSGVRKSHNDFGGRVEYVPNGSNGDFVGDGHGSAEDCYGHGTHVAGLAAGATYGVAKGARVWAARVLDCDGNGTAATSLAAVDWITANGQLPGVVNMSLGYLSVQSLHDAVANSIAAGFTYVVAAGNSIVPIDACMLTPANVADALTVGATEIDDDEGSFSSWGTCVDLLAPGVDVVSTAMDHDDAIESRTGTSQATPLVAGAAALYLCENPAATPAQVAGAILSNASPGRINLHGLSSGVTPNLLLHMAFIGACDGSTSNSPPIVFSAIPDTTVIENSPAIDGYRDLNNVFYDSEDGSALDFVVFDNNNTQVIAATINQPDSTLKLTPKANKTGVATIVIRATDSGGLSVDDTLIVTVVSANQPPTVVSAMPDTTITAGNGPIDNYRDLNDVFNDSEDGSTLGFLVYGNTNPGLVTVTIDADSVLDLNFYNGRAGVATIVVRAFDSDAAWVDDSFVVTVNPANEAPYVADAIPDTTVSEDSDPINDYRDLNDVFADAEDGPLLHFVVESNSNSQLVTATIDPSDSTLDLAFKRQKSGFATIVIRATDSGTLTVDDTLVVGVGVPRVTSAITDTTVVEDSSPIKGYRDLNNVFTDMEDGPVLGFVVLSNTNPGLVTPTIDSDSALGLSFDPHETGRATIIIRATDSDDLSVDESFVVWVTPANTKPPDPYEKPRPFATGDAGAARPKLFVLYQNTPNPFNPVTRIRLDTSRDGHVSLRIYDVEGRLVRSLVDRELPGARHEFVWNGKDDQGQPVASGVYYYEVAASGFRATKKMVYLK